MQSYDLNKTFSEVDPGVNIGRSVFTGLSHSLKTTLHNTGVSSPSRKVVFNE